MGRKNSRRKRRRVAAEPEVRDGERLAGPSQAEICTNSQVLSMRRHTIDDLPRELLMHIFAFLEPRQVMVYLSSVEPLRECDRRNCVESATKCVQFAGYTYNCTNTRACAES